MPDQVGTLRCQGGLQDLAAGGVVGKEKAFDICRHERRRQGLGHLLRDAVLPTERLQPGLEEHQVVGWWRPGLRVSGLDPLRERGDHLAGPTCVRLLDTGWGVPLEEVSLEGRCLGHRSASSLIGSQKGLAHGVGPQLSLYKVTSPYWGDKASEDSAVILCSHTGPMR
jgi:hypothetical protein